MRPRDVFRMTAMLPGALMLAACGPHHASWKEEVPLSPTETITVERHVDFHMAAPIGYTPGPVSESETIVVKVPGSSKAPKKNHSMRMVSSTSGPCRSMAACTTSRAVLCMGRKTGTRVVPRLCSAWQYPPL